MIFWEMSSWISAKIIHFVETLSCFPAKNSTHPVLSGSKLASEWEKGVQECFSLASITQPQACHRLRSGRSGGRGVGRAFMQSTSLKPSGKSTAIGAPWRNGCTHLCTLVLGHFLSGWWQLRSLWHPHCPTRTAAGRPLREEGRGLHQRRQCPYSPGVQAVGAACSLSPAPSLMCMELREPPEKGRVHTTHHTRPDAGGLRSLGEPGECVVRPPSWGPYQCGWCTRRKPKDKHLCIYFSPSHVILFLDQTQKLFGGWTAARWKGSYLIQLVSMPLSELCPCYLSTYKAEGGEGGLLWTLLLIYLSY